jgi:hypothetical protein
MSVVKSVAVQPPLIQLGNNETDETEFGEIVSSRIPSSSLYSAIDPS